MRPPLSPHTEAELRSACAYVVQNFKPSHIVYDEQFASQAKPQLDYAAIKESVQEDVDAAAPARQTSNAHEEPDEIAEKVRQLGSGKFSYKPNIATEDLFKHEGEPRAPAPTIAALRADQLMAPQASVTPTGVKGQTAPHSRSASNPTRLGTLAAPKKELVDRPRTAARTDSMGSTGSTPETDNTDYLWSEKGSTAMTSAAVTPARSSKRTSSQAIGSESSSVPKVETGAADGMRQELKKHKKAQEARRRHEEARDEAEDATIVSETTPTQTTTQAPSPVISKMPARKPVPTSRPSSEQDPRYARTDSTQSVEHLHPSEKLADEGSTAGVRRTGSKRANEAVHDRSRQADRSGRAASRARSLSRGVREYFRPSSRQGRLRSDPAPRAHSRSSSVTRQVKEYFRPSTAVNSRKPSIDVGRSEGRSRSFDSFRSTTSQAAPSIGSSTSKFKSIRPFFHRRRPSEHSMEPSRPGSASSTRDFRGRGASRDTDSASRQPSKPALDLNRELPPLPSLDQWQSSPEQETFSAFVTPATEMPDPIASRPSRRSQQSWKETQTPTQRPTFGERDGILAARMGSPTTTRSHQSKSSVDSRSAPPPSRAAPPPPPPAMAATMTSLDDLEYGHLVPTTSIDPVSLNADVRKEQRRSRGFRTPRSPDSDDHPAYGTTSPAATNAKVGLTSRAQLVHYSRAAGDAVKTTVGVRKVSQPATYTPTTASQPTTHSRTPSDRAATSPLTHNTDHTASLRTPEPRYRNAVEISSPHRQQQPQQHYQQQATLTSREKERERPMKSKWWQRKEKNLQSGWMDQVLKSGSSSGMIMTDEAAGAPIVRY